MFYSKVCAAWCTFMHMGRCLEGQPLDLVLPL